MKRNPSEENRSSAGRLLILSDGKPGHLNQSIAFAKHLQRDFDVCPVRFKSRIAKALSYLFDRCGLRSAGLFACEKITSGYTAVVSAGSETYYANRVLAHRLGAKSVAIMLPKGYRLDFDLIVAQQHDDPPLRKNILSLPINLTYAEPQGYVTAEPGKRYVAIIVGGHSKNLRLDVAVLRRQLQQVFALFPQHKFWLTTSRRTPAEVEEMLKEFTFDRAIYYSQEQINPISDFLQQSEYVFLTADSSSMVSEAVSSGRANVEVLGEVECGGKLQRFLDNLASGRSLHYFQGQLGAAAKKIDLAPLLETFCAERL